MTEVSFTGRVAIVTGGGRGLGAAYCLELARRGAAVVVHDNGSDVEGAGSDPAPANDVVGAIVADGGRALACTSDASTEAGGREAVDLAVSEFGRLDAIIANAGNAFNTDIVSWPTDRFESLLRHHLLAAFHVVRPGFAEMKKAGYGRIVFVSSSAGVFGQHGMLGYAAAKFGMLGLMRIVALEGAECGITANAIMPMARTRMADAVMGEASQTPDGSAFLDTLRKEQVAPVVAYLASQACTRTRTVLSAFHGRVAALPSGSLADGRPPTAGSPPRTSRSISRRYLIPPVSPCPIPSTTRWHWAFLTSRCWPTSCERAERTTRSPSSGGFTPARVWRRRTRCGCGSEAGPPLSRTRQAPHTPPERR